mmetsp:Transcript_89141/g.148735  ORF Transcript_89141/g.148735 Transcript_89141/m.148735 type:complete len:87 (-) Transcript_89141:362-622(-)
MSSVRISMLLRGSSIRSTGTRLPLIFFVPSSQVLATLEREGRVVMPAAKYKALEEQGLECPLCHAKFPTIPSMKKHYKLCYDKVRQ